MSSSNNISGPCQLLPPLMYPPPWTKNITGKGSAGSKSMIEKLIKSSVTKFASHHKSTWDQYSFFLETHLVCTHLGISNLLRPRIALNWMSFANILLHIELHYVRQSMVQLVAVPGIIRSFALSTQKYSADNRLSLVLWMIHRIKCFQFIREFRKNVTNKLINLTRNRNGPTGAFAYGIPWNE